MIGTLEGLDFDFFGDYLDFYDHFYPSDFDQTGDFTNTHI